MKRATYTLLIIFIFVLINTISIHAQQSLGSIPAQFDVSQSGAAAYGIPIEVPEGINGLQPNVSLNYNSQAGNGLAGWGWNIGAASSINRVNKTFYHDGKTETIKWTKDDALALDGNRLFAVNTYGVDSVEYRTEIDNYTKVMAYGITSSGATSFKVWTKEGKVLTYDGLFYVTGQSESNWLMIEEFYGDDPSNIYDDDDWYDMDGVEISNNLNTVVKYWSLIKVEDTNGNYIDFIYGKYTTSSNYQELGNVLCYYDAPNHSNCNLTQYSQELQDIWDEIYYPGYIYRIKEKTYTNTKSTYSERLIRIDYGGNSGAGTPHPYVIIFDYETRKNNLTGYLSGYEQKQTLRLNSINVRANNVQIKNYTLSYLADKDQLAQIALEGLNSETYKPTKIVWADDQGSGNSKDGEEYMAFLTTNREDRPVYADFDGDGMTDFMTYKNGHIELFLAYKQFGQIGFLKKTSFTAYGSNQKGFGIADLNGDGKLDIISITEATGTYRYNFYFFDGEVFSKGTSPSGYYGFNTTKKINDFFIGDFDGDGKHDILIKSTCKVYNQYGNQIASGGISNWGNETLNPFISNKTLLDITGNGKTNLVVMGTSNSTIYELEGGTFKNIFSTSDIDYNDPGIAGDFNGDGLFDFFMPEKDSKHYFLFSTGKSFIKKIIPDYSNETYSKTYAINLNNDGKSDVVVCGGFNTQTNKYVFNLGTCLENGFTFTMVESDMAVYTNSPYPIWQYMQFSDFDGDGRDELCYDRYADVMQYKSFTDSDNLLVREITNGMDERIAIDYSNLSDAATYKVTNNAFSFPVMDKRIFMNVVHSTSQTGSINSSTYHTYSNIRLHKQGHGFLGFLSTKVRNFTQNIETEVNNSLSTTNYSLLPVSTETRLSSTQVPISKLTQNVSLVYAGYKRYRHRLNWQMEENKLTGTAVKTTYSSYDSYGNASNILKEYLNGTTVTNIKETTGITYVQKGAWCPNKPGTVTVTKKNGTDPDYVRTINYEYDIRGNLTKETKDPGNVNQMVTNYLEYNNFGLPGSIETIANNQTVGTSYTYSTSGLFLEEKTDMQTDFSTSFTYYANTALLHTETNYLGLTTSYTYDGFGRLVRTDYADGNWATANLYWAEGNEPSGTKYYSLEQVSGQSPVWKWFDGAGRELRTEHYGLDGATKIRVDKEYNTKGQLESISKPYFEGNSETIDISYTYDPYGRVETQATPMGSTTMVYDGLTNSVTSPRGAKSETYNAAGQLETSAVDGTPVSYTYWPSGLAKTSTPNGGAAITTVFDLQGNRTSMTDPDAGTVTSSYNGFGELLWEEHKKTNESGAIETIRTDYTYDSAHRLLTISRGKVGSPTPEVSTHTYDPTTGFLTKIAKSGHEITYTYDQDNPSVQLGRVTAYTEKIGSSTFSFNTEYDTFGREIKRTYPSGYYTTKHYTAHGYLSEIKDRDLRSVWKAESANPQGQLLQVKKGTKTTGYGYQPLTGLPQSIQSAGIIDHYYEFGDDGNLNYREDFLSQQKEVFNYTTDNQLQGWELYQNDVSVQSYTMNYGNHGNITGKTDIGYTMSYNHPTKPHALTSIGGTPLAISQQDQQISYTDFGKVRTISEGYKYVIFTYGVDQQRRKAEFGTGENNGLTRYYLGDYELDQLPNGDLRKVHYISAGNGLAAIYVEEGSNSKFYYAYTDYLGSLTTLTDEAGTVVERHSFDAWGNRREPSNWVNRITTPGSYVTDRGFTMHEHLDGFALINMNGRIYDPVIARFLSPDPQLQAPGYWLNFNRYAYAYNNPMLFTDPTGEWIWFAIAAGMLLGGYVGGAAAEGWEWNPSKWEWDGDTWAGIGLGALIGGAGGVGFYYAAPALAKTGFFTHFGISGTVSAYTLVGGAAGGAIGYGAGFSGGMLYSNGDWGYSHQSGIFGAKVGATVGSVAGGLAGAIASYKPPKYQFEISIPKSESVLDHKLELTNKQEIYDDFDYSLPMPKQEKKLTISSYGLMNPYTPIVRYNSNYQAQGQPFHTSRKYHYNLPPLDGMEQLKRVGMVYLYIGQGFIESLFPVITGPIYYDPIEDRRYLYENTIY